MFILAPSRTVRLVRPSGGGLKPAPMSRLARFAVLLLSTAACGKTEGPKPDAKVDAKATGAAAQAGGSAAGAATSAATRVSECPRSLGGAETNIERVISRDCGPVTVVEDYRIDGGSLTLEAGAILQFKDGAGLVVGANDSAKLIVAGTPAEPVTFTSATDKAAGAWRGIELWDKAARSQIAGAVVEFAGDDARAVLVAAPEVTITGTTIRDTRGPALKIEGEGSLAAFADNTLRKLGSKTAIEAAPAAVAGLAGGSRFDGGAVIHVGGGDLGKPTTWPNPGVPLLVTEELRLDAAGAERATLTLSPGTELRFAPEGRLAFGGGADGGLVAHGTADAPITFTAAERREPGGWGGLRVWARGDADLQHAAFEFGGADDGGALLIEHGKLSLAQVTFRSNKAGVVLRGEAKVRAFADNRFAATPQAIQLPAPLVGALGEGNGFDADARIIVESGDVTGKTTWIAQGAPLELAGEVRVDAELTLDAGLRVLARPEAQLAVGGSGTGTLLARGTLDAPIQLGATAGVWGGIKLYGRSVGNILQHVVLSQTGDEPGVWVDGGGEARLDNVTCSKCKAAVVGWACGAKVSQSAVLATDGTPAIDARPEGC